MNLFNFVGEVTIITALFMATGFLVIEVIALGVEKGIKRSQPWYTHKGDDSSKNK